MSASSSRHVDRPLMHRREMIAAQPLRTLIRLESEPLADDLLEHRMHQHASLGRFDRQDRRRIRLVADTEDVLAEVGRAHTPPDVRRR